MTVSVTTQIYKDSSEETDSAEAFIPLQVNVDR